MKKILFSLAALLMVACTAMTFVSCSDDDSTDNYVRYSCSFDPDNSSTFSTEADEIYIQCLVSLGGKDAGCGYVDFEAKGDAMDAAIKSACTAAESKVDALTKDFSGTITYKVIRSTTNSKMTTVPVYTKSWTGSK